MSNRTSRRSFIKQTAVCVTGMASIPGFVKDLIRSPQDRRNDLYALSRQLLDQWTQRLLTLQVTDRSQQDHYGGILCPAKKVVHGRVGDTIYPLCFMAHQTGESKYMDAAHLLYQWMERRVSQADGSWLNEPQKGSWKGTTVFSAIALAEALKNHASVMDTAFKNTLTDRIKKAGDFIYNTFTIDYGNINYPISASYALSLLGTLLDIPRFREKGKDLARQAIQFITPEGFISGEGDPSIASLHTRKYTVDLGYNVEESLPALVLYGLLTKDEEVLNAATRSLETHMEFMLPDGGWDNSWGTRNYKWTYWGSRTSDGCQPAYALMADRDPRFYKAALRNTQILLQCTNDGLLQGGLHYTSHGIISSVHHTFCHIKAMTTILDYSNKPATASVNNIYLPREKDYTSRFFTDINTLLIAEGGFRATVTAYSQEYKNTRNGHASGGALTMLWHERTGPIITASMNQYQLYEADNMLPDTDPLSMPLTPRMELELDDKIYMNICDLNASVEVKESPGKLTIETSSKLVDKDQKNPPSGMIACRISYIFSHNTVQLNFSYENNLYHDRIRVVLPVISPSTEEVARLSEHVIRLTKANSTVKISGTHPITDLTEGNARIFNLVPGLEAIPLSVQGNDMSVLIELM